jgi:hypothetical protein
MQSYGQLARPVAMFAISVVIYWACVIKQFKANNSDDN